MSGHTPGPWEVREGDNDSRAFDVYVEGWKLHHGAWGRESDARLIAAAPDLLAAALAEEIASAHWEECTACGTGSSFAVRNGCGIYVNLRRDAEIKRRAAISKAEGK